MSRRVLLVLMTVAACGCASVGPGTVPQDQFNYNAAIARSSQQQLLVNLVRLRYNETPVFLKVSSVISQYSRVASATAGVGANTGLTGDNTASLGGGFLWSDRPTITYSPVSGQEFSRNLLTPLPPGSVFQMMQSGWPADLVLNMTTWSINDLDNDVARPSRRHQGDAELIELFEVWVRLRESGMLGIRRRPVEGQEADLFLFLSEEPESEELRSEIRRFQELLGVDPQLREFRVTYGLLPDEPGDIAVLTGSIWEIMLNLAWQFEVPAEHVEKGRTSAAFRSERTGGIPPIRVSFSEEEPLDAFVAVQEQGYWFFIDQNDRRSKRAFSFLQLLLNLVETATPDRSPLVTISN
jgi:hypothetical protein